MTMAATATGTGDKPTGLSTMEAANAFDELMTLGDEDNQGEEAATESDEQDPEAVAAGTEQEEAETETDESGEEQEEAVESEEGEEQGEVPADQKFTVRVDGKDEQVPLSELLAGYSRTADYTRKTQALANDRKTIEQERATAQKERAEYAALLPRLRQVLEEGMQEPDWEALRKENPTNAAIAWQRFQERKQRISAVKSEEARLAQVQAEEQAAERNKVLIEQRGMLLTKLPQWKDKKVAARDTDAIAQTMLDAGFSEEDLQFYDHRALFIAWKAAQYDALKSRQPALRKKMQKAPVVVQPGGGVKKVVSTTQKAAQRFNKSGSVKDAANLFATMDI